jgi:hypothetical protein
MAISYGTVSYRVQTATQFRVRAYACTTAQNGTRGTDHGKCGSNRVCQLSRLLERALRLAAPARFAFAENNRLEALQLKFVAEDPIVGYENRLALTAN